MLRPQPVSMESQTFTSLTTKMRSRIARMQIELDKQGIKLAQDISVASSTDAKMLAQNYDYSWFQKCLYSKPVKALIAKALIDAVRQYPYIDTSIWDRIARVA